jgi:peroxiredoxin family protein
VTFVDEPLNLVLFSGTDDKLNAAAVLTAGAAALGKPVNVFLQYWALDAFRADRIAADHGLAPEAGAAGRFVNVGMEEDPDIVLATTRDECHRGVDGRVLHVVARQGTPLLYVIERRARGTWVVQP